MTVNLFLNTASGGAASGDKIRDFENVTGSALADTLKGNGAGNAINGGFGDDSLGGGNGDDTLTASAGKDTLTGGSGADTFVLSPRQASADIITDFKPVDDTLQVSAADFGAGLAAGALDESQFVQNTTGAAGDGNDRFIYKTDSGELFFDSNGSAAGGRNLIATFSGTRAPVLSHLDILIV